MNVSAITQLLSWQALPEWVAPTLLSLLVIIVVAGFILAWRGMNKGSHVKLWFFFEWWKK